MRDFELVFEKNKNCSFTLHNSYFFEIQKQLQEKIKKELIKKATDY